LRNRGDAELDVLFVEALDHAEALAEAGHEVAFGSRIVAHRADVVQAGNEAVCDYRTIL
jgi:hypothetical protein